MSDSERGSESKRERKGTSRRKKKKVILTPGS